MSILPADLHCIKVSGPDAKKFLQGQLTCHLDEITPEKPYLTLAAHCNPQGRVISLFDIWLRDNSYYLLMQSSMIAIAISALKKYAVFFKVTIESTHINVPDASPSNLQKNDYQPYPILYPETSGKFLPHELNLDKIGAISFNKGCYTGQEIIARMHYRGKLKKHLHQGTLTTKTPPQPGQDVYKILNNEVTPVGTVVNSVINKNDTHTILLVCDDDHAKNNLLFIQANEPKYITFSFY